MYFGTKSYLKNNRNHTAKHAEQVDLRVFLRIEPEVKYSKIYRGQTIF